MSPLKEYLYIYYGRIPDRKDPPYEYIELVRGTSDYTPQTVEKSFYAHNRVEMGKFAMTQGDVLVWFEGGWPVVVLVGDTAFERREPTAVQCRELVGIWPVSYTHLDVYKRQIIPSIQALGTPNIRMPIARMVPMIRASSA